MGWLFAQVWLLCVVAFLLGSLVTWVVFVWPARRAGTAPAGQPWALGPAWTGTDPVTAGTADPPPGPPPASPAAGPPPGPGVDPALSGLGSRSDRAAPGLGAAATGALDSLGVRGPQPPSGGDRNAPAAAEPDGPVIPAQAGPADAPPPDGGRPAQH